MGFFDFIKNAGKSLLGRGNDEESIKQEIEENNATMPIENLEVSVDGDTVTLKGNAKNAEDRAKAALIAGNINGVSKVVFDDVSVEEGDDLEEEYYEIKSGDTLWAVASKFYGDGSKYTEIVKANLEVIKNADKIYPGQKIRIPNL